MVPAIRRFAPTGISILIGVIMQLSGYTNIPLAIILAIVAIGWGVFALVTLPSVQNFLDSMGYKRTAKTSRRFTAYVTLDAKAVGKPTIGIKVIRAHPTWGQKIKLLFSNSRKPKEQIIRPDPVQMKADVLTPTVIYKPPSLFRRARNAIRSCVHWLLSSTTGD